jgi:hypothetical protein
MVLVELSLLRRRLSSVRLTLTDAYSVGWSVEAKLVIVLDGEDRYDLCPDNGRALNSHEIIKCFRRLSLPTSWGHKWGVQVELYLFLASALYECQLSTAFRRWLMAGERTPTPIEYETGLTPKPFWTLWKWDRSFAAAGIRPLDPPARTIITTLTMTASQYIDYAIDTQIGSLNYIIFKE